MRQEPRRHIETSTSLFHVFFFFFFMSAFRNPAPAVCFKHLEPCDLPKPLARSGLAEGGIKILSLPISNADSESVFSQVSLTKTDLRNKMKLDVLLTILRLKFKQQLHEEKNILHSTCPLSFFIKWTWITLDVVGFVNVDYGCAESHFPDVFFFFFLCRASSWHFLWHIPFFFLGIRWRHIGAEINKVATFYLCFGYFHRPPNGDTVWQKCVVICFSISVVSVKIYIFRFVSFL